MRSDSPFYSHCFEVISSSPLLKRIDKTMRQDILLIFQRETWVKNAPAMDSSQTIDRFYVIISGRMKVCQINPSTCREQTILL